MMKKIRKCIIPAAGFGTRFLPATKAMPKEMLPIVDKPVIQYLVEEAVASGCEEIIFVTGRLKRSIEDHFDISFELEKVLEDNNKTEYVEIVRKINSMANIFYVRQPLPRWDWDAILRARSFVNDEPFLVLFGDDIMDSEIPSASQLIEVFNRKGVPVIWAEKVSDDDVSSYWVVESSYSEWKVHKVSKFMEKPKSTETKSRIWVIWKYVLTPDIFIYLEEAKANRWVNKEVRLADAFIRMLKDKDIYALELDWVRYDTWTKIWFLKATINYALKNIDLCDDLRAYMKQRIKD